MRPLVISGPSGVGKSFIVNELTSLHGFGRVVPYTTRQPRPGEVNGQMYNFVSPSEYSRMNDDLGFFMDNEFFEARYGMPTESVTGIAELHLRPVSEILVGLVSQFVSRFPQSERIFIEPQSFGFLEARMKKRGDSPEQIKTRLAGAEKELTTYNNWAHRFFNKKYTVKSDRDASGIIEDIVARGRKEPRVEQRNPQTQKEGLVQNLPLFNFEV